MSKFFKKLAQEPKPNPKLEAAVTSRIALEMSKNPKAIKKVRKYDSIKNVPFIGPRVKKEAIERGKKKHGKFMSQTFGNISDKKLNSLAGSVLNKTLNPNISRIHAKDSLNLVRSGQTYPAAVNRYSKAYRKKWGTS
jgi:hypothetical protein